MPEARLPLAHQSLQLTTSFGEYFNLLLQTLNLALALFGHLCNLGLEVGSTLSLILHLLRLGRQLLLLLANFAGKTREDIAFLLLRARFV